MMLQGPLPPDSHLKGWKWIEDVWSEGDYEYGISDDVEYHGHKCLYIRSLVDYNRPDMFFFNVALAQLFVADQYRGKRMKFSVAIKTDAVNGSATVIMSVIGNCGAVAYDFTHGRNITAMDWKRVDLVLDVQMLSTLVAVGIGMSGNGQIWASDLRFEETSDPMTGTKNYQDEPTNFNFNE